MFIKLFTKELKYQFTHLPIYIVALCFILEFCVNFDCGDITSKIIPKQSEYEYENYYGRQEDSNFETVMENAYNLLSYYSNYGKYLKSYGDLNKYVDLNKQQKEVIDFVLKCLVPKNKNDDSSFKLSKSQFKSLMRDVNRVLNGNDEFSAKGIRNFRFKHKTYEEALRDYEKLIEEDKLTNSYGRLFADYMGIAAGIIPVFIAAFTLLRDRKYRIHEFIYSSKISSYKYVLSKYLSNVTAIFALVIILAIYTTINFMIFSFKNDISISILAFLKYSVLWVLPTIMFVIAVSYLLQLIFNSSIITIIIQFVLWQVGYKFSENQYALYKFVIRYNKIAPYSEYKKYITEISVNRIFILILSIIITIFVCLLWNRKRENIDYKVNLNVLNKK